MENQVSQQGLGFGRGRLGQLLVVTADVQRAQEVQTERRHGVTSCDTDSEIDSGLGAMLNGSLLHYNSKKVVGQWGVLRKEQVGVDKAQRAGTPAQAPAFSLCYLEWAGG
jgi:hypothetical protein